jgi:hypothetical protein
MKPVGFLLAGLLGGAVPLIAEEAPPSYSTIVASMLPDLPSREWPERQFVQADKEGRVFVLREDTLDLYQLSGAGKLVPKGRILEDDSSGERSLIFEAAMSPAGDAWALFSPPDHLYLFRGGRLQTVEPNWVISGIAVEGGEPLIAVSPLETNIAAPSTLRLDRPPLVQQWDGKRWNTLIEGRFPENPPEGVKLAEYWRGEFSVLIALTPERRLWMADQNAYRLRRYSPSGALQDELSVGGGKVVWRERTEEEWAEKEQAAKKAGFAGWSRSRMSPVHAEEVVQALTVGHDGAVYLLVKSEQGLALDRFDTTLLTLERVLLKGLDVPGRITMTGGKHGLYIAAWAASNGIWQIDSETLQAADWKPVEDAVLNGQPLAPPKELEEPIAPIAPKTEVENRYCSG